MDTKKLNTLMTIVSTLLLVAGLIFLCVSIFGNTGSNTCLICALGCILAANLFNVIRTWANKNK